MATKKITLDCGIEAEIWSSGKTEWLQVSLIDLYNGHGDNGSLLLMSSLFFELHHKGYQNMGLTREVGYYDMTNDLVLQVNRHKQH